MIAIGGDVDSDLPAVHEATRELLYAGDREDVMNVLVGLVVSLGGQVIEGSVAISQDQVDLSLDDDHPVVATAMDAATVRRLRRHLPTVVADARASLRLTCLAYAADVDPLTGLANRRAADRMLPRLRDGDVVAVIDLDHFKRVNDEHGHQAGDLVLSAFGRLLQQHSRVSDIYLRTGGEEFLGVFHNQPLPTVVPVLERLRQQWTAVAPHPCTFSAGAAAVVNDDGSAAWRRADQQMYRAKSSGRDRVCA